MNELVFRPGTYDMLSLIQTFRSEQYKCLSEISDVRTIVDLGAYVGYSSYYMKSMYPKAKLVAIEPNIDSHQCCVRNLKQLENVHISWGAAWPTNTKLRVILYDNHETATKVTSKKVNLEHSVPTWPIPKIMKTHAINRIDILKIDIEGSERALFSRNNKWISKVRNIAIEIHNIASSEAFFNAMDDYAYKLSIHGELTVCKDIRPKI